MNLNDKAQKYLTAYSKNATLEDGLAFGKALQQAQLDYSPASLDRIDMLLDQMREKLRLVQAEFIADSARLNFALLLAFYLGSYISKRANSSANWYDYPEACRFLPANFSFPETFAHHTVALIGGTMCTPLQYIEARLFNQAGSRSCQEFCHDHADTIELLGLQNENERSDKYLRLFFERGRIPGGLAFAEQLQRAKLDYSLDSLDRIDLLLRSIQKELKPDYLEYVNSTATSNFLLLLAFYIGAVIAHVGALSLKWGSYEELRSGLQDVNLAFESSRICVLNDRLYFILGAVSDLMFNPKTELALRNYADGILRANPSSAIQN